MDPLDYLKLVRRRWPFLVVPIVVGLVLAYVTTPAQQQFASVRSFTATHTLLLDPDLGDAPNFDRLTLFATTGEVPQLAAKRLGSSTPGPLLAARVQIAADPKVGSFKVSVSGADGPEDARIADAFAEEIKAYLVRSSDDQRRKAIGEAQMRVDALAAEVQRVQAASAAGGNVDLLNAQKAAQVQRYSAAFTTLINLQEQPPAVSPLETLQTATPIPVVTGGFTAPSSRRGRLLVAFVLALALGLAAIVLLDRFDTRLRRKDEVEDITRLPVLAEVPALTRADRRRKGIAVAEEPTGAVAEAYRTLRSALLLMPDQVAGSGKRSYDRTSASRPGAGSVFLITSPSAGDGKTTSVANLAAAFAEAGHRVLALDCDFRRPALHTLLGVSATRGLSEVLGDDPVVQLGDVLEPTSVDGVTLVTAGTRRERPAALVARLGPLIDRAAELADIVLIDCPPLLTTSDSTDLLPYVDTVVMLVRSGATGSDDAQRAAERLARVGMPTAGIAIIASQDGHATGAYDPPAGGRDLRDLARRRSAHVPRQSVEEQL